MPGGAEDPAGFAREADGFERLWTPHRMAYIGGENKPPSAAAGSGCPFCRAPSLDDDDALVVARGELCFVVLNLYPYNPGHLMVCPYRHVAGYVDLTPEETVEVATLTQSALRVLSRVSNPSGFNLGVNQGEAGGAGIAAHLHQHVVPRWTGDANFLPVVGRTKALPELLADTRAKLAAAWAAAGEPGTASGGGPSSPSGSPTGPAAGS
ncbi:HIT domain-containing protein [Streptomyces sp. NP160]|uniref:HIT family protein n=1 Tax=Streptomyces sp. NP160 TaxID=2586637 RepID=UPI00214B0690|nr:HIT domain-containing protein [Streptomyces sp. NP160]